MLRLLPLAATAALLIPIAGCNRAAGQASATPHGAATSASPGSASPSLPAARGSRLPAKPAPDASRPPAAVSRPARPMTDAPARRFLYPNDAGRAARAIGFARHTGRDAGEFPDDGDPTAVIRAGAREQAGGFVHRIERGPRFGLAPGEQIDRIEVRSPEPAREPFDQGFGPDSLPDPPYGDGAFANGSDGGGAPGRSPPTGAHWPWRTDGTRRERRPGGMYRRDETGRAAVAGDRLLRDDVYPDDPYRR